VEQKVIRPNDSECVKGRRGAVVDHPPGLETEDVLAGLAEHGEQGARPPIVTVPTLAPFVRRQPARVFRRDGFRRFEHCQILVEGGPPAERISIQ